MIEPKGLKLTMTSNSIQGFLGADRLEKLIAEYTKEVGLENMDLANKMFDEFLEEINRPKREFYQKTPNFNR